MTTIHGFSSPASCPSSSSTTTSRTTSRSATPTGTRASTTPRRSITGSTCAQFELGAAPGELPALLRADPSRQGHRRGDRGRRARRAAARDRRHRPGPRSTSSELVDAARRRRARHLRRPGRARAPRRAARRRARAPSPRQLRRAVRLQRRRGDGLRDAGDRDARGSMPEIVRHGENGFLVALVDEAVAAVERGRALDGEAVRASVVRPLRRRPDGRRLPRRSTRFVEQPARAG